MFGSSGGEEDFDVLGLHYGRSSLVPYGRQDLFAYPRHASGVLVYEVRRH